MHHCHLPLLDHQAKQVLRPAVNARDADVWLLESNSSAELKRRADELNAIGIQVELGKPLALESFEALPRWPSTVVISPGIAFDHPVLNQLRDRGCRVVGEVEVAWQAMASIPWIGITGTNGKTTVTSLVAHLLQQGGLDAPACGNIGASAAELALACLADDISDWFKRDPPEDWRTRE